MLEQIIRRSFPADWLAFGLVRFGGTGVSDYADGAARSECGLRGVTSLMRFDWAPQLIEAALRILAVPYRRDFRSQKLATLAR